MTDLSSRKSHTATDGNPRHSSPRQSRDLPPAARRALAEAEERRKTEDATDPPAREIGGRGGKDPVRYGDWEIKGRAIDF